MVFSSFFKSWKLPINAQKRIFPGRAITISSDIKYLGVPFSGKFPGTIPYTDRSIYRCICPICPRCIIRVFETSE